MFKTYLHVVFSMSIKRFLFLFFLIYLCFTGTEGAERVDDRSGIEHGKHRRTGGRDGVWRGQGDRRSDADRGEGAATEQSPSVRHGGWLRGRHASPQNDPHIRALGLLRLHGHWEPPWKSVLGQNPLALHRPHQTIQVRYTKTLLLIHY